MFLRLFLSIFVVFWLIITTAFVMSRIEQRKGNITWIANDIAIYALVHFVIFYLFYWIVTGDLLGVE